jgi:hypothetical protein
MQSPSAEHKAIAFLHDAIVTNSSQYSILEALSGCPEPWSNDMWSAVSKWMFYIFNPRNVTSTSTRDPYNHIPFWVLRDLLPLVSPSGYIRLLELCEAHIKIKQQETEQEKGGGFSYGWARQNRLSVIRRWINRINRIQVIATFDKPEEAISMSFREYKLQLGPKSTLM